MDIPQDAWIIPECNLRSHKDIQKDKELLKFLIRPWIEQEEESIKRG